MNAGSTGLLTFALGPLVVVSHFETGAAEAALDVEALVLLAAVENGLVAANVGGDVVEGLDEAEAQLLALLVLGDGNVFDVAYFSERMDTADKLICFFNNSCLVLLIDKFQRTTFARQSEHPWRRRHFLCGRRPQ